MFVDFTNNFGEREERRPAYATFNAEGRWHVVTTSWRAPAEYICIPLEEPTHNCDLYPYVEE